MKTLLIIMVMMLIIPLANPSFVSACDWKDDECIWIEVGQGFDARTRSRVEHNIPPGFVPPFPGSPIPEGFLSKETGTKAFNDVPHHSSFKTVWVTSSGQKVLMVPEGDPRFYSSKRSELTDYHWIRLKGRSARPYVLSGTFDIHGKRENLLRSEPESFESLQQRAIERIEEIPTDSREIVAVISPDVKPQSVSNGIMLDSSVAGTGGDTQWIGGAGVGRNENHLNSFVIGVLYVYEPLLPKDFARVEILHKPKVFTPPPEKVVPKPAAQEKKTVGKFKPYSEEKELLWLLKHEEKLD